MSSTSVSLRGLAVFGLCLAPILYFLVWLGSGAPPYSWDAAWYRSVADQGYVFNGDILRQHNVAFLPGYPLIIKLIGLVTGLESVRAQQVTCFLAYFAGSFLFYRVLAARVGEETAALVMAVWTTMPFSIYFLNGYAETILFALAGAFFYLLERRLFIPACLVMSYGLITRHHAMAFGPPLLYALFRAEQGAPGPALGRAMLRCIALAPYVLVFPALLTIYWFIRFDDSLVYKAAIHAWGEPAQAMRLSLRSVWMFLSGPDHAGLKMYNLALYTVSPQKAAVWLLVLNLVMTLTLLRSRFLDFFLFNATVLTFILAVSNVGDLGRHSAILFSIPLAFVVGAQHLLPLRAGTNDSRLRIGDQILSGSANFLLVFAFAVFGLHFVWYAMRQLNGVWVS